jgi:hypothetical protein
MTIAALCMAAASVCVHAEDRLRVVVYDYTGLPIAVMTPAVEMARQAFQRAGIVSDWRVCDAAKLAVDGCPAPLTACADAGDMNLDKAPHSHPIGTLSRLNALTGKQDLLKIRYGGEVGFTFLSVYPAPELPAETDDEAIQAAITLSRFLVRFDEGTLIDGSDTRVISGRYVSLIRGKY